MAITKRRLFIAKTHTYGLVRTTVVVHLVTRTEQVVEGLSRGWGDNHTRVAHAYIHSEGAQK